MNGITGFLYRIPSFNRWTRYKNKEHSEQILFQQSFKRTNRFELTRIRLPSRTGFGSDGSVLMVLGLNGPVGTIIFSEIHRHNKRLSTTSVFGNKSLACWYDSNNWSLVGWLLKTFLSRSSKNIELKTIHIIIKYVLYFDTNLAFCSNQPWAL